MHLTQGDSLVKQGQLEPAIAEYSQAIELHPNFSSAYKARGLAYFNKGQWDLVITDLNNAVELAPKTATDLNPKLATAYSNRGQEYNRNWRYDLAIRDFTNAIELDPGSASARIYAERGKAYLELGNTISARSDYNRAIDLDPKLLTGQELADIMSRGCLKITTVSMDIDATMIVVVSEGSIVVSLTAPMKGSGVVDYNNKKMRIALTLWLDLPGEEKKESVQHMYVIDGWAYNYAKWEGAEGWFKNELDDTSWETQDQFFEQRELLKTTMDITLLGSEKIDGVDCHVFLIKPDLDVLTKYFSAQYQQMGIGLSKDTLDKLCKKTVEIKEWITKDEYLPVKIDANMVFETASGETMPQGSSVSPKNINHTMKIQLKFKDFNKPVVIDLPPEAFGAKERSVGR